MTWAPLPRASFTAASDGGVDIQTTVPGFFALLPDTVPPSRPDGVTGRFVKGSLRLTWPAATDNAGPVASYNVLLDGLPLATVTGASRRAIVHSFHPDGPTVYRVQAVDAVGNVGTPSQGARRPADEAADRDPARAAALGLGPLRLAARPRRPAREGAEEASCVVLALGRLARGAVPPQALSL